MIDRRSRVPNVEHAPRRPAPWWGRSLGSIGVFPQDCFARRRVGQDLIDHDDGFIAHVIVVAEKPALEQRDAHDAQIIRCHGGCQRDRHLTRRRRGWSRPVAERVLADAHGDDIGQRGGLNSRYTARAIEDVPPSGSRLLGVSERARRERDSSGQHIMDVDAWVEGRQPTAMCARVSRPQPKAPSPERSRT